MQNRSNCATASRTIRAVLLASTVAQAMPRFSDILTALSLEYLGVDPVALRELAGLKLTAEMCQA
jgi:hypothetical protein